MTTSILEDTRQSYETCLFLQLVKEQEIMLYKILRPLASLALLSYFRKIHFSHRERVPKDKPVLLASNHPTAFIEPCIFACFQDRELHFLVRGDFFREKIYRWFLENLNMIPIYRKKDGFKHLRNNRSTFERCYEALSEKATIMILAEGRTILGKRLRPVQRGAARIAFGAIEENKGLDIHLVPAGANFMDPNQHRTEAMVGIGKPIRVLDYWDQYLEDPNGAIQQLTRDLSEAMRKEIIHVEDHPDDDLVDQLLGYMHNEDIYLGSWAVIRNKERLAKDIEMVDRVNLLSGEQKENLRKQVDSYAEQLEEAKVTDYGLQHFEHRTLTLDIVTSLLYLPYVFFRAINYPPLWLARFICDRYVDSNEFYGPVKMALSMAFYVVWCILLAVVAIVFLGWPGLIILFLLPLTGFLSLKYHDWYVHYEQLRCAAKVRKEEREELILLRREIWQEIL